MICCDICNGELTVARGGQYAVCEQCGMKHTIERVKEKLTFADNSKKATEYQTENFMDNGSFNEDTKIYDANFTPLDDEIVDAETSEVIVFEEENTQPNDYEAFVKKIESIYNSQNFSGYEISRNVPAFELGANKNCIPVNFLFKKNDLPVLAVLLLKVNRHSHIAVTGTMKACENKGVNIIYFYKDMPNKREYVLEKTIAGLI